MARMREHTIVLAAVTVAITVSAAACAKRTEPASPVAEIAVAAAQPAVEAGAPFDLEYRFTRLATAPLASGDYWVFVHVLDSGGTLLWTDDHQPPVPVSAWGGVPVRYQRTMFVPRIPYAGTVRVEAGLYSRTDGARLALAGHDTGSRAYDVAHFDVRPASNATFVVFGDGWYGAEREARDPVRAWRWSKGDARLSFRNPGRDAVLSLELDQPIAQAGAQTLELRAGSDLIDTIAVSPVRRVYRVALPASRLGTGPTIDLDLRVRPTFTPAAIAALASQDSRELGVRVFNVYLGV
jgi:hypothetical protein